MEIKDILHPDCTLCAVEGTSKKRILELISQIANQHIIDIDQSTILASLMTREKMGSTGIGGGIALPHGRLSGLKNVTAIALTSNPAIPYEAIDNAKVDVFFAILVPEEQANEHLQTLAKIATIFSDKDKLKSIRAATTAEDLHRALT